MKRTLLILFTVSLVTADLLQDNDVDKYMLNQFAKDMATYVILTEQEVYTCINKTNITYDEVRSVGRNLTRSKNSEGISTNIDYNENTLKVGCFYSCLAEKKELIPITNTNLDNVVENIKNILNYHMKESDFEEKVNEEVRMKIFEIMNICVNEVKSEPDECKIVFKFTLCYVKEATRL